MAFTEIQFGFYLRHWVLWDHYWVLWVHNSCVKDAAGPKVTVDTDALVSFYTTSIYQGDGSSVPGVREVAYI